MTALTIDPAVLDPQGVIGKATNYPEFYDEVIAAINDHASQIDNIGTGSTDNQVSVKDPAYNARGDYDPITETGTDDRAAFILAIAAALLSSSKTLVIPPGNYYFSRYVNLNGARGLRVVGSAFATIYYPSDDTNLVADGTALSSNEARSAFLVTRSTGVVFENVGFVGGTYTANSINLGVGIYLRNCVGTTISRCTSRYGHSLMAQDATAGTSGTGTSLAVSGDIVTLTDADAVFVDADVGLSVTITNTSTPSNSGVFEILARTATTLRFRNAGGVAETSSFSWQVDNRDRETVVERCRIEKWRGVMAPGPDTVISRCVWELPMTYDLTGIGDSFTDDGATTTLRDANGTWGTDVIGKYVRIARAVSAANDGLYRISNATAATRYSPATLTYANASGVTESTQRGVSGSGTTTWWIPRGEKVGAGAGVGALAKSGDVMTLTAASGSFASTDVGKVINLNGCTSVANASAFIITEYVSSSQIRYENSLGVAEDFSGVWQIDGWDSWSGDEGIVGSSHAVYVFGGKTNIRVERCEFYGVRRTCVKASGSSAPILGIEVVGCFARECGSFFVGGADDVQRHGGMSIHHNTIVDCGIGRQGWQDQVGIDVLGSNGTLVENNQIRYTRGAISYVADLGSVSDRFAISAKRYARGYSEPLTDISVTGNVITADPRTTVFDYVVDCAVFVRDAGLLGFYGSGGTLTKSGNTMTLSAAGALQLSRDCVGMRLLLSGCADAANDGSFVILSVPSASTCTFTNASGVGSGAAVGAFRVRGSRPHPSVNPHLGSGCRIVNNTINAVGSFAFKIDNCMCPEIRGNTWGGVRGVSLVGGNAMPTIAENRTTSQSSNLAEVSLGAGTTWPIVYGNRTSPAAASSAESYKASFRIADAAGTIVDYPLLGMSGRVTTSDALEEMVVGFGGGFADGDTIYVYNGSTLTGITYTSGTAGAGEFNTFAELVSAIGAISGLDCADYGADFTDTPSTQHMRIRGTATSATDGTFYVLTDTCNPNSLVVLVNAVQSSSAVCRSRGAGAAGPTADKAVVWSPLCRFAGGLSIAADNASAQTLLVSDGYRSLNDEDDDGCNKIVQLGGTAGTEEFRWSIT